MLRTLTSVVGSSIHAADGEIGHVRDLLFDDRNWVVRYLVVETGSWLAGRRVLISPLAAQSISLEGRSVHVTLTKDQIQGSPDINTDLPVSRQQEADLSAHFAWPAYWLANPVGAPLIMAPPPMDTRGVDGDPNLRSVGEVTKYAVKATDGELGHVSDLILEDANWFIRFLVLKTGGWFASQNLMLSTRWIGSISWAQREVLVPYTRDEL
ncbi:MAG: PRC-barrel domain-containing protein [Bryobacteraceae bacterium]